jgi:hypothetical protein
MNKKEQKEISDVFPELFHYIKFTSLDKKERHCLAQPFADNINEHQALIMLDRIHPTGALLFPYQKIIIFEYNKTIFEFSYGEDTYIINGHHLRFDVDDGFSPRFDSPDPIVDQLNQLFIKWKANNYRDPFIPSYNCLDVFNKEDKEAINTNQSSFFNQANKRKHDSIDPNNIIEARTRSQSKITRFG